MENTKEITTVGGHKVVLKTGISYGDHRSILNIYLNEDGKAKAQVAEDADRLGVKVGLVSIDGATENLFEAILGLPLADGKEVMKALEEVLSPKA